MNKGQIIDHTYQLIREIGEGGAGVVYLAYHLRLEKYVVIKKLKGSPRDPLKARKEVDILKSLHHKYLPQVYDYLEIDQSIYTIIDYIEGYDLASYPRQGSIIPEDLAIKWISQLSEVLGYLHQHGIIHGDIKPSNIMVTPENDICLIDFNISFDAESIDFSGFTPAYASPEQIAISQLVLGSDGHRSIRTGSEIQISDANGLIGYMDYRTDIYSLGASFYHLMTGVRPYVGVLQDYPLSNIQNIYRKSLLDVVEKAMSPELTGRYQTASEMHKAAARCTDEYKTRFRIMILVSTLAVFLLITGITVFLVITNGKKQDRIQHYTAEYNQAVEEFNQGTYDSTEFRLYLLKEFVNNDEQADLLESRKENKAEIYYMIGYTSFLDGDYSGAVQKYQEAMTCDSKNVKVKRELAICNARMGDLGNAEYYLTSAEQLGLDSGDTNLIKMEIELCKGNFKGVMDGAGRLLSGTVGSEQIIRSAGICMEACEMSGDYDSFLSLYEGVLEKVSANQREDILRLLLEACYMETELNASHPREYLYQGMEYFQKLSSLRKVRSEDRVIMAGIYIDHEWYTEAITVISEDQQSDSDYVLLLWKAYAVRKRNGGSDAESRNILDAALSSDSYKSALAANKVDRNAERLIELLQN